MKENIGYIQECPLSFKVILLGDSFIGKTSFIHQFIANQFMTNTKPTISVDFVTKTYQVDEFSVRINIFDTAGQQRYKSLTKSYFKGTDAVLFMYSMENKQSFSNIIEWIQYFERESESRDQLRVLVGTKKDILAQNQPQSENNISKNKISREQIKQLVEAYKFTFKFQTSAKDNLNINLVFEQLSRNLIYNSLKRKKSANNIREQQWSIILKRDKEHLISQQQKNKGCC